MIKEIRFEQDVIDAALESGCDDREAYNMMAAFADNTTDWIILHYDTDRKLFRLYGDVRTRWTDPLNVINILTALNNSLWNLPEIGEDGVIDYSTQLKRRIDEIVY